MGFCPKCGQKMEGSFCSNCGNAAGNIVGAPKEKQGLSIASMVLGIVALVWALMELAAFENIEEALLEAAIDTSGAYIGFFIGFNLLSLPCGVLGLIFGLKSKKNGKAIAGLIMSGISLLIVAISLFVIIGAM